MDELGQAPPDARAAHASRDWAVARAGFLAVRDAGADLCAVLSLRSAFHC